MKATRHPQGPHLRLLGALALWLAACSSGCASTPQAPRSLVAAHAALERAQLGPAREQAPAHLARAEVGFATARAACANDPGSSSCRDWCYVAHRRAEQAEAEAGVVLAHRSHQRAHLALAAHRSGEGPHPAQRDLVLPMEPSRLPEGIDLGAAAEHVQSALARLAPDVPVATGPLSGLTLQLPQPRAFVPGKSTLLPQARHHLAQIAHAMQDADMGRLHVSSQAAPEDTHDLARARAQSVLAYLIACGLPATRAAPAGPPGWEADTVPPGQEINIVWLHEADGTQTP